MARSSYLLSGIEGHPAYSFPATRVTRLRSRKAPDNIVSINVDGSGTADGDEMLKDPVASGPSEKGVDALMPMLALGGPDPESSSFRKSNVWMPVDRIPSHAITAAFAQTLVPL